MIYTLTLNPAIDRELTVEEIEYDKVLTAAESRVDFGGKGFNVSRMLCSLGTPSVAVGFMGGRTGERLQKGLQALDIDTDFGHHRGSAATRLPGRGFPGQAQRGGNAPVDRHGRGYSG